MYCVIRSEMHMASVSVRFGLILEAYCRGSREHMHTLERQLLLLEKLKNTAEKVRHYKDKDKAKNILQEILKEPHFLESFSSVQSPLEPSFRYKNVR